MMTGSDTPYALVESSRGCSHRCIFCSQWRFWEGTWRTKSAKRIVDEIEYCSREFGSRFFWFTDDNFGLGERAEEFCDELINRNISEDIIWFTQARSDDIVVYDKILPKMRKAGNLWILMGLESNSQRILESFRKDIDPSKAKQAVRLLKKNDIFAQATFIIGERKDSRESIKSLQDFANDVDPDISIFMALTPYPGTELYENAKKNGWIEDTNWANYDMAHAIMPTEYLSRKEIQEELYECYRSYYGSMKRRITGLFSPNVLKRRTYRHLMSQGLLNALRDLF
jgi:anaerobic magnesium-protoporphyrin IX monomethyl ester cyclase